MQGQRNSAIGSFSGTLRFEHGSTSSDAGNRLPDSITSPGDISDAYPNSTSQEGHNLSGWNGAEPSYGRTENDVSHNERIYEPDNIHSLNGRVTRSNNQIANAPLFVQSPGNAISQDLNVSEGFEIDGSDDCRITECPNAYKSDGLDNSRTPFASSSSDPFGLPFGSGGYLVEEKDGRPGCSLDGRRLSCKRKVFERNNGQSSISGSSSCFHQAESTVWRAIPGRSNAGSSLNISTSSENILGVSSMEGATSESPLALNLARNSEMSHRTYRARMNPTCQQDSLPINEYSTVNTGGRSLPINEFSQQQSSRLFPLNTSSQRQSIVVDAPDLQPTSHPSRWNGGLSSRPDRSSGSSERDSVPHEESNSIGMPRNISEHPVFIPANEMRNSAQNSTNWSLTGGNTNIAGNVASTSRTGSSSRAPQLSGPNRVPLRNPQYPRRLSELVRRSLLTSAGSESGGQNGSSLIHSGPSSQEMALPDGNQGHHLSQAREAMLLERQLEGALRIPHSLRTLAAASEGRSRLVSEIRGVLDLMRRGEGLRFEDVMILDQSVFFGMGDVQDRHRDMRLDIDNMSYEDLLALEERIGNVCTGLSEETILKRLKQRKYVLTAKHALLEAEPCCVCQEEYNDGEDMGKLECGHEFHANCIKQWLMHKNLCPICKKNGLTK